jgi:hypothetical protein
MHTALGPANSDTVSPLEDDADNVTGDSVITTDGGGSNEIACGANDTAISRVTGAAGSNRQSPPWLAVTTHNPGATRVIVAPASVQIESGPASSDTVRPLEDDADNVTGDSVITTDGGGSNVIACGANDTAISRVTGAAGSNRQSPPWLAVTVHAPLP